MGSNATYLRELKEYLVQRFAKQKTMIRNTRALRHLLHEVDVPDAYKKTAKVVRTPLLADMVQRVTATLTVNEPSWRSNPLGISDKAKELASLKEKWMSAAFRRMEQESGRRTFRMLMSAAVGDGMGVAQLVYRPQVWRPWPRREKGVDDEPDTANKYLAKVDDHTKKRPFAFSFVDHDPLTYYYHDDEDGVSDVLLVKTVPLAPVQKRLGIERVSGRWQEGSPGRGQPEGEGYSGSEVQLTEHHTKHAVTYMIDDEVAKVITHNWGRLTFHHFAGLSSHESTPERTFLPVTFAFEHLIPLLDRLLTMKANWAYLGSFPQPILKLTQNRLQQMAALLPDGNKQPEIELGPLLTLYEGEDFAFATPPPVGTDLNQLIELCMRLIEQAGLSSVMKGQTSGASGYETNQLITAARLTYDPITDNARFAFDGAGQDLLWMIDRLVKRKVYVWGELPQGKRSDWLGLGPDELDGMYWIESKLDPLLPSNYIMEGTFGMQQYQGGAISMETHRDKYLHLESPEEEEVKRYVEDFKNSKFMHDLLMQKVAEKAGLAQMAPPPPPPMLPPGLPPEGGLPPEMAPGGGVGMPVQPGLGMPLNPSQVPPPNMPGLPGAGLPGITAPAGAPGGNFGQQVAVEGI